MVNMKKPAKTNKDKISNIWELLRLKVDKKSKKRPDIKITKAEWQKIGKKSGWLKTTPKTKKKKV